MDVQLPTSHPTAHTQDETARPDDITPADLLRVLRSHPVLMLVLTFVGWGLRAVLTRPFGFPLNDGGMITRMAQAVINNGFRLPLFFGYNGEFIPFAHPPLGVYLAAAGSAWLGLPLPDVLQTFPFWLSVLHVPAFYLLAFLLLRSRLFAATATLIFTAMPGVLVPMLAGGAVVTGLALLLALLTLALHVHMVQVGQAALVFPVGLGLAAVLLTHLETSVFLLASLLWVTLIFRPRQGVVWGYGFLAGVVAAVIASLWLGPVLWVHGLDPYRTMLEADALLRWTRTENALVVLASSAGQLPPLFGVLALLGAGVTLAKRRVFLVGWLALGGLLLADSVAALLVVPVALLAAIALHQLVIPLVISASRDRFRDGIIYIMYYSKQRWLLWLNRHLYRAPLLLLVILLVGYGINGARFGLAQAQASPYVMSQTEQNALAWAAKYPLGRLVKERKDFPPTLRFLVLTNTADWRTDTVNNWFSVLTPYPSMTNVYDNVYWGNFPKQQRDYLRFYDCLDEGITCLYTAETFALDWRDVGDRRVLFTHVLVTPDAVGELVPGLLGNPDFTLIYDVDGLHIFQRDLTPEQLEQIDSIQKPTR